VDFPGCLRAGRQFSGFLLGNENRSVQRPGAGALFAVVGEPTLSPLKNPAKFSAEVYFLLFVIGLGLAAMLAAILLTLWQIKG